MTPAAMAALHAACFTTPPPWSAADFAAQLASPHVFAITADHGFLLGRAVADEAEVLTLAVDPAARRRGTGLQLITGFLATAAHRAANRFFLEVAADNAAAIALYTKAGFTAQGRRRAYYRTPQGTQVDALVMTR